MARSVHTAATQPGQAGPFSATPPPLTLGLPIAIDRPIPARPLPSASRRRRRLSRPAPRAAGGSQAQSCPAAAQGDGATLRRGHGKTAPPAQLPAPARPHSASCRASLSGGGQHPRRSPRVAARGRADRPRLAQVQQGPFPPSPPAPGRGAAAAAGGGRAAPIPGETSPPSARAALRAAERRLPPEPLHLPASGPLRDRPRGEGKRKSPARPGEKRRWRREEDAGQPRFPGCPSAGGRGRCQPRGPPSPAEPRAARTARRYLSKSSRIMKMQKARGKAR